jgi:hypothetical protein
VASLTYGGKFIYSSIKKRHEDYNVEAEMTLHNKQNDFFSTLKRNM